MVRLDAVVLKSEGKGVLRRIEFSDTAYPDPDFIVGMARALITSVVKDCSASRRDVQVSLFDPEWGACVLKDFREHNINGSRLELFCRSYKDKRRVRR